MRSEIGDGAIESGWFVCARVRSDGVYGGGCGFCG